MPTSNKRSHDVVSLGYDISPVTSPRPTVRFSPSRFACIRMEVRGSTLFLAKNTFLSSRPAMVEDSSFQALTAKHSPTLPLKAEPTYPSDSWRCGEDHAEMAQLRSQFCFFHLLLLRSFINTHRLRVYCVFVFGRSLWRLRWNTYLRIPEIVT